MSANPWNPVFPWRHKRKRAPRKMDSLSEENHWEFMPGTRKETRTGGWTRWDCAAVFFSSWAASISCSTSQVLPAVTNDFLFHFFLSFFFQRKRKKWKSLPLVILFLYVLGINRIIGAWRLHPKTKKETLISPRCWLAVKKIRNRPGILERHEIRLTAVQTKFQAVN